MACDKQSMLKSCDRDSASLNYSDDAIIYWSHSANVWLQPYILVLGLSLVFRLKPYCKWQMLGAGLGTSLTSTRSLS